MRQFITDACGLAALALVAGDPRYARRWLDAATLAVLDDSPEGTLIFGERPVLLDALAVSAE